MSVVSIARSLRSTLLELIRTKLPDDLKRMIYEDHFKEEMIAEKYYSRIVKVFRCRKSTGMVTNIIMARLLKIILENEFLTKKFLENEYFLFEKVVYNYKNNIVYYDCYRESKNPMDKYMDLVSVWFMYVYH